MKHFWLTGAQQKLMDTATSTSSDYGHIAFLKGKYWKQHLKEAIDVRVKDQAQLRTYDVTGLTSSPDRPDTILRLAGNDAMRFKLRFGGEEGRVIADPTGECWGNLLIAQYDKRNKRRAFHHFHRSDVVVSLALAWAKGIPFGPLLGNVDSYCKGLPRSWAKAFVWEYASFWHEAHGPAITTNPVAAASGFRRGHEWAAEWLEMMQCPNTREQYRLKLNPRERRV